MAEQRPWVTLDWPGPPIEMPPIERCVATSDAGRCARLAGHDGEHMMPSDFGLTEEQAAAHWADAIAEDRRQ